MTEKVHFGTQFHFLKVEFKFICEGYWVKVKVTRVKAASMWVVAFDLKAILLSDIVASGWLESV